MITDIDPNNFDETFDAYYKSLPTEGIPGMTAPAINFRDAPVNFMMRQNNPAVFDPLVNVKNFAQNFPSNVRSGITSVTDKGIDLGKAALGGIMSLATGIPFAGNILTGITSQFENRPLGAPVIDEFGNVYDEEELNSMNALGGYYTEAARSARRRTARIANMLERQRLGKVISIKNLQKLQAQEKKQEEMRQAAAQAMQDRNRAEGRGGYQSNFAQDRDFMEGRSGASTGLGASDRGGSDTMGSFMDGGIVDLVDIYD